jgi:signal transduction histidine kinase/CheY-like chemotaxis protein/PAS domain-containing protein
VPRVWVITLGLYALVGGFLSFIGWPLDLQRLTDWYNNGISIQPNSTIAVTSSGVALLCLALGYLRVASLVGLVVLLMGSTALLQWITPISLPEWNTLLMFGRQWGRVGVVQPGLMGPPGSLCWTLIGVALVLSAQQKASVRQFIPRLALVTAAIGGLSIAGYLYGAERLFSQPYFTVIALQTATFVVAVSVGCMAAVPEHPPTRWLLDEGATGAVARRAVPLVIFIPFFAGWLRLFGERRGLYDTSFGTAGLVLILIILLLALLSWMLRTVSSHETTLRDTERRVTATLESITDGFVTLDRDWRYQFVNVEAAQLLRRSQSELLGTSAWEAFPDAVNSTSYRELHRAVRDRVSVAYEDYQPVLGRWFSNRAYPTSDGAVSVYFQDVTARKEAEFERAADLAGVSRLQTLSTKLVQSGDYSSLLQEIVAGAAELTGTTKGNIQVLNAETGSLEIVVHQGFGPAFLERFQNRGAPAGCDRAVKDMKRVELQDLILEPSWQGTDELRVLLEDGIRAFQSTPLVSRGGRLLGVLSTHFTEPHTLTDREIRHLDLLARMAADFMERSQAETMLKNGDRLKDEFLAMLAHELRNPLAPIVNAVQILRATNGADDTVRSTTDMLQRQVSQLSRLTDDLVDVSRITRGKIELVRQKVDLQAVMNQAVEAAKPLFDTRSQKVDVELPAGGVYVDGDFTRLTQVVGNLLSNAAKFSSRNANIALQVREEPDGWVVIHVRDTGIGIKPEDLPHIFDLFMQGDRSLERSTSGLGIGLTLVKTLVEMHGGTVEARSAGAGKGSEFIVRLPIAFETVPEVAPASTNGVSHRSQRVLIVDDNEDGAASLANVLMLAGHVTLTAHDGVTAVSIAEQFRPDVVVLDIGLPRLNGYETCKRIRAQSWGRTITMVALTGWGQESYRQQSSSAGFDTHLVKPVDADTLLKLVNGDNG